MKRFGLVAVMAIALVAMLVACGDDTAVTPDAPGAMDDVACGTHRCDYACTTSASMNPENVSCFAAPEQGQPTDLEQPFTFVFEGVRGFCAAHADGSGTQATRVDFYVCD
jgi:hypothetical protein